MNKETVKFKDIKIGKTKFNRYKNPFLLEDVDNDTIFRCNKVAFGKNCFKYFIGSKDNDKKVSPLYLGFSKVKVYRKF